MLVWLGLVAVARAAATAVETEEVFYLGDPQIGFSGNASIDAKRFGFAAAAAVAAGASHVVIAGDLVNIWNSSEQVSLYMSVWPSSFGSATAHQIPGNHDVNSESTSTAMALNELDHYRTTFGKHDFSSFQTKFGWFSLLNSEMLILPFLGLNGTTDPKILTPVEAQWGWLETELEQAAAAAGSPHVVLVMHHPPFIHDEDEVHQYFNWPLVPRRRLLALARKYNVGHFLCGHTHTTTSVSTSDNAITILTTAGTAVAFDQLGCGYRVVQLSAASVNVTYKALLNGGGSPGCKKHDPTDDR